MRLKAPNGVVVDATGAAVPRLLDAGFAPVREDRPNEEPKAVTTRKPRRATRK